MAACVYQPKVLQLSTLCVRQIALLYEDSCLTTLQSFPHIKGWLPELQIPQAQVLNRASLYPFSCIPYFCMAWGFLVKVPINMPWLTSWGLWLLYVKLFHWHYLFISRDATGPHRWTWNQIDRVNLNRYSDTNRRRPEFIKGASTYKRGFNI